MSAWNVVVSVHEQGYKRARELLEPYGCIHKTDYYNVLTMTVSAEEMIAHCRGRIGGYKIPRRYVFPEALPKSAMDKILKTELRRICGGKA